MTATMSPTRRYPLDLLAEELHLELGQHGGNGHPGAGLAGLANYLGVSARTLRRWRHIGLNYDQADHYANLLGKHPAWIWGDDWYDDTDTDLGGDAATPCRCGPQQRPLGRICDRCGHDRHRTHVRTLPDTG